MAEEEKGLFDDVEVISVYTSAQAVEDGILFDILEINKDWERGIFRYITTNLMSQGYMTETQPKLDEEGNRIGHTDPQVNIPNVLDLLNQANEIVRKASKGFTVPDTFYSGKIELPSGDQQEIFIELNELNKFTIMLPEDR